MSRLPLQARTIASLARPCFRSFSRVHRKYEDLPVQRVRIRKPYFTTRRLATWAFYSTCLTAYFYYVMPVSIEVEGDSRDKEGRKDGDGKQDEEEEDIELDDEDAIFIPLGLAKKKKREFYKGSDPEWQAFVQLARDSQRHKRLQEELVSHMAQEVSRNRPFAATLGGNQVKVKKYWLDMFFPSGPPQEYEQTGIEIGDEYIALATRDLDQIEYARFHRAFWPSATMLSFYASIKILAIIQWERTKEALGWPTQKNDQLDRIRKHLQAMQRLQKQQREGQDPQDPKSRSGLPGFPRFPFPGIQASPGTSGKPLTPSSAVTPSSPNNESSNEQLPQKIALNPSQLPSIIPPPSQDIPIAMLVFRSTMARNRDSNLEPPRGSCVVDGMIEFYGTRSIATVNVTAAFDVAAGRYVWVRASVRKVKPFKQAPLGGA